MLVFLIIEILMVYSVLGLSLAPFKGDIQSLPVLSINDNLKQEQILKYRQRTQYSLKNLMDMSTSSS